MISLTRALALCIVSLVSVSASAQITFLRDLEGALSATGGVAISEDARGYALEGSYLVTDRLGFAFGFGAAEASRGRGSATAVAAGPVYYSRVATASDPTVAAIFLRIGHTSDVLFRSADERRGAVSLSAGFAAARDLIPDNRSVGLAPHLSAAVSIYGARERTRSGDSILLLSEAFGGEVGLAFGFKLGTTYALVIDPTYAVGVAGEARAHQVGIAVRIEMGRGE